MPTITIITRAPSPCDAVPTPSTRAAAGATSRPEQAPGPWRGRALHLDQHSPNGPQYARTTPNRCSASGLLRRWPSPPQQRDGQLASASAVSRRWQPRCHNTQRFKSQQQQQRRRRQQQQQQHRDDIPARCPAVTRMTTTMRGATRLIWGRRGATEGREAGSRVR